MAAPTSPPILDVKTRALVRVAALVATRAPPAAYRRPVGDALAAGASADEVVATLLAVAPTVGLSRLVLATAGLADGLGLDLERDLEGVDGSDDEGSPVSEDAARRLAAYVAKARSGHRAHEQSEE